MGFYSRADAAHARAQTLVRQIQEGEYGTAYMSELILAETLNYLVAKARDRSLPQLAAADLYGEPDGSWVSFLEASATWRNAARDRFRRYAAKGLSYTDCSSVAAVEMLPLDAIASFDRGFDGIIARVS